MIYRASREIQDAFTAADLKCQITENGNNSIVRAGVSGQDTEYTVLFISRDDDSDVAVRVYDLVKFNGSKLKSMERVANALNRQYRFVRFVVDKSDNTLGLEFDFPERTPDVGKSAVEIFIRIMKMVDDTYKEMMKAIWS